MIDSGGCGRSEIRDRLRTRKTTEYLSQSAIAECVTEFRPALDGSKEQQVITEQLNRGFPVPAPHSPREGMIVPSQSQTVHRLLDPSLFVDDACVVGDKKLKKLLPFLVSLQAVNWETFTAIMFEIAPA
jgi:hypothetical protein